MSAMAVYSLQAMYRRSCVPDLCGLNRRVGLPKGVDVVMRPRIDPLPERVMVRGRTKSDRSKDSGDSEGRGGTGVQRKRMED